MNKQQILQFLIAQLQEETKQLAQAADAARDAATHAESKAEDAHDTRSIEASYLAAGQSQRVLELKSTLNVLSNWQPRDFKNEDAIALGALVTVKGASPTTLHYFLCPAAGGSRVTVGGKSIGVITIQSALGAALLDARVGDEVELPDNPQKSYEVLAIS
jgi:transcription elongation GreA/GreB family factor